MMMKSNPERQNRLNAHRFIVHESFLLCSSLKSISHTRAHIHTLYHMWYMSSIHFHLQENVNSFSFIELGEKFYAWGWACPKENTKIGVVVVVILWLCISKMNISHIIDIVKEKKNHCMPWQMTILWLNKYTYEFFILNFRFVYFSCFFSSESMHFLDFLLEIFFFNQ